MSHKFAYTAFDRGGKSVPGILEATSEAEVREMLRHRGLFVAEVKESSDGAAPSSSSSGKPRGKRVVRGKALKNLTNFTRQLHVLIASGTPLVQALGALERQSKEENFKAVVADVRSRVEEGVALSEAMRSHPNYFDDVCRSLISAGEAGGRIDAMLDRLARLTRAEAHVRSNVVGAMVYPALLIVISIGVMSLLLTFVLPRFAGLFVTLGSPLPPTTKAVMTVSDFLTGYWWAIIGAGAGVFVGVRAWLRTPIGRRSFDTAIVRMPIIGKMIKSFCTARIARLLGIQLESKVPLLEALKLTKQAAGNLLFQDLIGQAEEACTRGQSVSTAFAASSLISPAITEAMHSGEQTGQMSTLLISIADFLDEENEVVVRSLTSIIEPMILIVLGVMVGFVAVSMFLPLFDLTSTTSGGG
ncbi:type II secretion system F family protein [soil metagenome]